MNWQVLNNQYNRATSKEISVKEAQDDISSLLFLLGFLWKNKHLWFGPEYIEKSKNEWYEVYIEDFTFEMVSKKLLDVVLSLHHRAEDDGTTLFKNWKPPKHLEEFYRKS